MTEFNYTGTPLQKSRTGRIGFRRWLPTLIIFILSPLGLFYLRLLLSNDTNINKLIYFCGLFFLLLVLFGVRTWLDRYGMNYLIALPKIGYFFKGFNNLRTQWRAFFINVINIVKTNPTDNSYVFGDMLSSLIVLVLLNGIIIVLINAFWNQLEIVGSYIWIIFLFNQLLVYQTPRMSEPNSTHSLTTPTIHLHVSILFRFFQGLAKIWRELFGWVPSSIRIYVEPSLYHSLLGSAFLISLVSLIIIDFGRPNEFNLSPNLFFLFILSFLIGFVQSQSYLSRDKEAVANVVISTIWEKAQSTTEVAEILECAAVIIHEEYQKKFSDQFAKFDVNILMEHRISNRDMLSWAGISDPKKRDMLMLKVYAPPNEPHPEAGVLYEEMGLIYFVYREPRLKNTTAYWVENLTVDSTKGEKDFHFRPHPAFPDTRAEFSASFRYRGRTIGVLDIQTQNYNSFTIYDIAAFTRIAESIGLILDDVRTRGMLKAFDKALDAVRKPILLEDELTIVYETLLETALDFLDADLSTLFVFTSVPNYHEKEVEYRVHAGDLIQYEKFGKTIERTVEFVREYVMNNIANVTNTPDGIYLDWIDDIGKHPKSQSNFFTNESIVGRIIATYQMDKRRYGILFINYRRARPQNETQEMRVKLFVKFAILALQRESYNRRIYEARDEIARFIHDYLQSKISVANYYAGNMLKSEGISELHRHQLNIISNASDSALQDARRLQREITFAAPGESPVERTLSYYYQNGFAAAVELVIENLKIVFPLLIINSHWQNQELENLINPGITQQLVLILYEAVLNVSKHAQAEKVDIILHIESKNLHIEIRDNGLGIPIEAMYKPYGGIFNMRKRAASINADFTIRRDLHLSGDESVLELSIPLVFE